MSSRLWFENFLTALWALTCKKAALMAHEEIKRNKGGPAAVPVEQKPHNTQKGLSEGCTFTDSKVELHTYAPKSTS